MRSSIFTILGSVGPVSWFGSGTGVATDRASSVTGRWKEEYAHQLGRVISCNMPASFPSANGKATDIFGARIGDPVTPRARAEAYYLFGLPSGTQGQSAVRSLARDAELAVSGLGSVVSGLEPKERR